MRGTGSSSRRFYGRARRAMTSSSRANETVGTLQISLIICHVLLLMARGGLMGRNTRRQFKQWPLVRTRPHYDLGTTAMMLQALDSLSRIVLSRLPQAN
jgi:hypothetical protein